MQGGWEDLGETVGGKRHDQYIRKDLKKYLQEWGCYLITDK